MRIKMYRMYRWIAVRRINQIVMVVLTLFLAGNFTDAKAQSKAEVRLVLQITIDGLRADLIKRYENGFGKSGFRFLMDKGIYYTNAQYQHANTETIVGHATLATGTFPSQQGMATISKPQTVHRRVHPVDVAPTIAALLGMTPPGSAQGSSLDEVFQ